MDPVIERLLGLWRHPPADEEAALVAFRAVYTDPFRLNGESTPVAALVARARGLHAAFADLRAEVLDLVEAPGKLAVVLQMSGRHVGPLMTPVGTVQPSGRAFTSRTIDVLTLDGDQVCSLWVVPDDLGTLTQLAYVSVDSLPGT